MNLKLRHLLTQRTLHHLSYVTSSSPFFIPPLSHLPNPNPNPNPRISPLFSKSYHSSPFLTFCASQSAIVSPIQHPHPDSPILNEFLACFANPMKSKLREMYQYCNEEKINGMLDIIVDLIVKQFKKDQTLEDFDMTRVKFRLDLWRDVIEISKRAYFDMDLDKAKHKGGKFLQCDQVTELTRLASEVGVRGNLLHELRFKWARDSMESSCGDVEDETNVSGIASLHNSIHKVVYMIYGVDLSHSNWKGIADKVREREERVWGCDAKEITGKAKIVADKIVLIENVDDLVPLLSLWKLLVHPSRIDWFCLLYMVKAMSESLYLKVAEHVLSELSFQPDIHDYAMLIDIHAKESRLKDAERIRDMMVANGMTPNVTVLKSLFQMYTKAVEFVKAKECFEALNQGLEPDLGIYTTMIMTCVDAGEVKHGEELLNRMETLDLKPAEDVYMALLRGYSKLGDVKGAHRIETSIVNAGYQPNLELYTLLVETYAENNDVNGARNMFDNMMQLGIKPDDKCMAVMIAAYAKNNELDAALQLLFKLEKEKIKLETSTYRVLVDWFGKLQVIDEAENCLAKKTKRGEGPSFKIQVRFDDMYFQLRNEHKARTGLSELVRCQYFWFV